MRCGGGGARVAGDAALRARATAADRRATVAARVAADRATVVARSSIMSAAPPTAVAGRPTGRPARRPAGRPAGWPARARARPWRRWRRHGGWPRRPSAGRPLHSWPSRTGALRPRAFARIACGAFKCLGYSGPQWHPGWRGSLDFGRTDLCLGARSKDEGERVLGFRVVAYTLSAVADPVYQWYGGFLKSGHDDVATVCANLQWPTLSRVKCCTCDRFLSNRLTGIEDL